MTGSPENREKRLAQLKREVTKRGFDRHASVLKDIDELPVELHAPAAMKALSSAAIETAILFPQQLHRGWDYVPKQALLFTSTGVIHLLASIWSDQEPSVTFVQGSDLLYMNVKLLLLYGFLEIIARGQFSPVRLGMEFNTVAWCVLSKPLRRLLQSTKTKLDLSTAESQFSSGVRQIFTELPLKFSNGVKIHGLLPGEHLEELTFQPGVWRQWLHVFPQPITANTLLMLTSNFVVAIREELKVAQGWILTYIPRGCINDMQIRPGEICNELIIELERQSQRAACRILLDNQSVEAWRLQWTQHGGKWKDHSIQVEMR